VTYINDEIFLVTRLHDLSFGVDCSMWTLYMRMPQLKTKLMTYFTHTVCEIYAELYL